MSKVEELESVKYSNAAVSADDQGYSYGPHCIVYPRRRPKSELTVQVSLSSAVTVQDLKKPEKEQQSAFNECCR
jgi:hypothetical protein